MSVEESAVNRRILKSWWGKAEQDGELRQLPNVRKLNSRVLEEMMKEFGGFDLVIGGNYRPYKGGTNTVGATMGMDSSHFFEYVRVVQSVRDSRGKVISIHCIMMGFCLFVHVVLCFMKDL